MSNLWLLSFCYWPYLDGLKFQSKDFFFEKKIEDFCRIQVFPVEEDVSKLMDVSHMQMVAPPPPEEDEVADTTEQTSKKRFRTFELANRR